MHRRARLATALAGVAFVTTAIAAVLAVPAWSRGGFDSLFLADLSLGGSFGVIGWLVTRRRPDNPIGWIFLAIAATEGVVAATGHYAIVGVTAAQPLPGTVWAGWLGYWLIDFVVPSGLFVLLLTVFPNGRPLSRRWRWLVIVGFGYSTVFALSEILTLPTMEVGVGLPEIDNPTHVVTSSITDVLWLPGLGFLAVAAGGLVIRFRRASGDERQQLRWFVTAVAASVGGLILLTATYFILGAPEPEPAWLGAGFNVLTLGGVAVGVPLACGVAVLRYRLWDLDVVIRKAVLSVIVALLLMSVFALAALGTGSLAGGRGTGAVIAAGIAGLAFWPALRVARRIADRVVYGHRATPYEILTAFSGRLGEAYATDDVLPRLAQVLGSGTGAEVARVWLVLDRSLRQGASWPADAPERSPIRMDGDGLPPLDGEDVVEVRDQGEILGALSVVMPASDPMDPSKERLVRDLASQAGLVLRNVRLVEDLRASRQRLVAAQDAERRRIERNIHDGAQQQLVALAVKARLTGSLVERDPRKAAEMLSQMEVETQAALDDLRDLARGIYPPLLADRGLVEALRAQARKAGVPTVVEANGSVARYEQEVEATVYFCALEALQNVAKYAAASAVTVRLEAARGQLVFQVVDDGRGFDPRANGSGSGLVGMTDRMDAIGGSLEVHSAPGEGTSVIGRIPVGSPNGG